MRGYCFAVLAFCTIVLSITCFTLFSGIRSVVSPVASLDGRIYSEYISYDYYVERVRASHKKSAKQDINYSNDELIKKWGLFKKRKILIQRHNGVESIYNSITWFIIFGFLMIIHIFLLKKFQINK